MGLFISAGSNNPAPQPTDYAVTDAMLMEDEDFAMTLEDDPTVYLMLDE